MPNQNIEQITDITVILYKYFVPFILANQLIIEKKNDITLLIIIFYAQNSYVSL